MKTLIAALALLTCFTAYSQVADIKDISIAVDGRKDDLPGKDLEREQGRVRIGFTIDAHGIVEIIGLAGTGSSFNNDWATLESSNGTRDEVTLAFRQLYLKKVVGRYTIEAGAMSPEPTVGSGGLGAAGWMDGIRVKTSTRLGNIKVVAGSLGDFSNPHAFTRKFDTNFLEIEVDYKVFKNLVAHTALENYNGDNYLRQNLQLDLKILGDRVFKLFADALYDIERNAYNYEIGTQFDLLKNLIHKYEHRIDVKVYFSSVDEKIPGRSDTLSAFYTYGPRFTTEVGGKIDRDAKANWFARGVWGKQNRFDVGVSIKLNPRKK